MAAIWELKDSITSSLDISLQRGQERSECSSDFAISSEAKSDTGTADQQEVHATFHHRTHQSAIFCPEEFLEWVFYMISCR